MTKDRVDFGAIRARVDLLDVASRYTDLRRVGREHKGPCPICGGGEDRFCILPDGDRWFCRVCAASGRKPSGDVCDLVAAVEKIPLKEAAKRLGGGEYAPVHANRPVRAKKPPKKPIPEAEYRQRLFDYAALCASRVEAAAEYLTGRGIKLETAKAWGLGFDPKFWGWGRPAVVLPYRDGGTGVPYNVKGRFTDGGKPKLGAVRGGAHRLFGLNMVKYRPVLIVVEGELNALALWQEMGASADVLSIGSESNLGDALDDLEGLVKLAGGRYRLIVAWFDKGDVAVKVAERFWGVLPAVPMKSPKGLDAADLVKIGADVRGLVEAMAKKEGHPINGSKWDVQAKPGKSPTCPEISGEISGENTGQGPEFSHQHARGEGENTKENTGENTEGPEFTDKYARGESAAEKPDEKPDEKSDEKSVNRAENGSKRKVRGNLPTVPDAPEYGGVPWGELLPIECFGELREYVDHVGTRSRALLIPTKRKAPEFVQYQTEGTRAIPLPLDHARRWLRPVSGVIPLPGTESRTGSFDFADQVPA